MKRPAGSPLARLALDSILAFAFFSALTGFVEATYTFGLLGTDIPPEIVYVLFLLSPVLLLAYPRIVDSPPFVPVTGSIGLASWAASIPLDTRWRMLLAGAGCGLLLLCFAGRLRQAHRSPSERATGLGLGVLLSILFRAAHSGSLMLADRYSLPACAVMACLAIALLWLSRGEPVPEAGLPPGGHRSLRAIGLSLGLFGGLTLLYFGFTSPAVIARWGGVSYPAVMAVETGALVLFLGLWLGVPGSRARLSPGWLAAWNLLFLASLAVALRLRQPTFGASALYPLYAPQPGAPAAAAFWVMLALHPVIYADVGLLAAALRQERPSPRGLARGFAVGSLFLLLLVFSQIFTTVYDYIPVVGPWFRDRFWLVVAVVPGVPLALSVLLLRPAGVSARAAPARRPLLAVAALGAVAVLIAGLTGARPEPAQGKSSLRIMSWNLQQGSGKNGEQSLDRQLAVIRRIGPDILGLQETDTARVAGGNADLVRYLADALDMYSYYGPEPESGTFGIALLSRYPIEGARTFFMPSRGEQTATVDARTVVGDRQLHVLVTHLDNDGAMPQQRLVVDRAAAGPAGDAVVVAMGDFNFDPSTEQYRFTTSILDDAWARSAERIVEPGAPDPAGRIDHIFVSRGATVLASRYVPEGPSDHPAMVAEIAW